MQTISSSYLKMIYNGCVALCDDESALLPLVPNGVRDLENPSKRFDRQLAPKLLNETVKLTGDETVGLKVGMNFKPETLLDIGYAFPFCENLREVIAFNAHYQALIQRIGTTKLSMRGDSAWLVWAPNYNDPEFYRYFVDMIFTGYATIGRWLIWGDDNPVLSMHFRHSAPPHTDMHKRIFSDNLVYGADTDMIEFLPQTVDVPMPNRNPEMLSLLKVRLDAQLAQLAVPLSASTETLRCIQVSLGQDRPTIGGIAAIMGMSERSLRRKLTAEGESFRGLLERARKENCEAYMRSKTHTQSDIALMLGFSDHSAYSRAFKQWFGQTPRDYKDALTEQ